MIEDQMLAYEWQEQAAAVETDSKSIQNDLESIKLNSNQHPIKVSSIDLCQIAERLDLLLNVDTLLSKLTEKENEAIFKKLEQFEMEFLDGPEDKRKRTMKRKKELFLKYVKNNCTCVAYLR